MVTGISFASAFCRRIWIRLRRCRREIPPVTLMLDLFRGNVEGACDEFAAKKYSAFEGSARDQIGDSGGRHNQQIGARPPRMLLAKRRGRRACWRPWRAIWARALSSAP